MADYSNSFKAVYNRKLKRIADGIQSLQPSFSISEAFDKCNEDIVKFLKEKKTAMKDLTKDPSFRIAIKQAHAKIVKELLEHRALINTEFRSKIHKLMWEFNRIIELFIKSGDQAKPENNFNYDLFDTALINGYINIVKDFLEYGFDVNLIYNSKLDKCCTALHRAAQSNQEEIAKLLISYGADVNLENDHGKTALFYATKIGNYNIIKLLLDNGANANDPEVLQTAVVDRSLKMIQLFIQHGVNINIRDQCGRTALHFVTACKKRQNIRLRFGYEDSIRGKIAKLLLDSGAYVDARTRNGITTLHAAALKGYSQVAEILLYYGATVDLPTFGNKTALFFAAHNAYGKVVQVLLRYGADINCIDTSGRTALDMAYTGGVTRFAMICDEFESKIDIVTKYTHSLEHEEFDSDHSDYDHYDNSFYYGYRRITIDVLNKHVMKLIAANLHVREELLESFVNARLMDQFKEECQQELDNMKGVVVINNIIAYNLIKMNLDQLAIHTKNWDILKALEMYNYSEKFPLYETVIRGRIKQAIEREEVLIEGYEMLETVLSFSKTLPRLPANCMEQIIGYLDSPSIIILIRAFSRYTYCYQKKK